MQQGREINYSANSSTLERVLAGAGVLSAAGSALVVRQFNPVTTSFFPVCPLYALTGIACPGCGLTRGFHALFNGDVLTAMDYNALIPIYAFIFGYLIVSLGLIAGRGRGLSWKIFKPKAMYGFLIAALAFAVLRNLPFYPFSILAP